MILQKKNGIQKLNGIGLSAGHDGFRAGVRVRPAVILGLGHQSRPDDNIFDVPAHTISYPMGTPISDWPVHPPIGDWRSCATMILAS